MSGPLIHCSSCTRGLTKVYLIIESIKEKELSSEEINVLLATNQESLLQGKIAAIYDDLKLNLCCRMNMANVDHTPEIYGSIPSKR